MRNDVDLSQLAVDRDAPKRAAVSGRRHLLTRFVVPIALLLGFASLTAWSAWDVLFPAQPVTVVPVIATTAQVREEGTPLFKAAGWIEPRPTPIRVAALEPGVVREMLVVEDQPVKKNQAVAELVVDDAELALERALATLALREAELQQMRALLVAATKRHDEPVHLDAPVAASEAELARVKLQLKNLPHEIERAQARWTLLDEDLKSKLSAQGVVSGFELAKARTEVQTAKALLNELRGRTDLLKVEESGLTDRRTALVRQRVLKIDEILAKAEAEAKVKAAVARLEQGRVDVKAAKLRRKRMTVRALREGRVYKLIAQPGTRLEGGMTQMQGHDGSTVVTLYQPGSLQVRVDVRFEDLPRVQRGQPVRIENPALSQPLTGTVLFRSSITDIQKNTAEVKVAVDDPPSALKPDMLMDVTFLAPKKPAGETAASEELRLYLPRRLVQQSGDESFVWLADVSNNRARRVPVTLGGARANGLVEVTQGLNVASRVIASGHEGLKDGQRIRVTGEASPGDE